VATNPTATATAQAGPSAANTLSVANTMDRNANATVAAEARMTRPMLAVAVMTAASGGVPARRCSW